MNILTLSLRPDVTVVAVLVPDDMHSFQLGRSIKTLNKIYAQGEYGGCRIDLPPGQYEIVGLLRDIPEEQAAGLAQTLTSDGRNFAYRNYTDSTYSYLSAINSLKSAIKANGGDPELNWLLIKKIQ